MVSLLNPLRLHGIGGIQEISRKVDGLYIKIAVLNFSKFGHLAEEIFLDCQVKDITLINFISKIEPLVVSEAFVRMEFEAEYLELASDYYDQSAQASLLTIKARLVSVKNCRADDVHLCIEKNIIF